MKSVPNDSYDAMHNNCGSPVSDCLAQLGLLAPFFQDLIFPEYIGNALMMEPYFNGAMNYIGPDGAVDKW